MGVYLSQPQTTKHTEKGTFGKISFFSAEMQGWRRTMEDAIITKLNLGDNNALFAVFDGHGGFEVSKLVAEKFPLILLKSTYYKNGQYSKALDESFRKMDELIDSTEGAKLLREIRKKQKGADSSQTQISGSTGCTANVVLITPNKIIVANAGDSRSVLCRNGTAVALSHDHKPESPIQQNRIKNAGGSIVMGRVNGGLNLTRSFGDFDYKRKTDLSYDQQMITCKPDIEEFNRQKNDQFILIGCDGIWQRYVENNQGIIDKVRADLKNKNEQTVVIELLDFLLGKDTREGLGCDNMSAILVRFASQK